MDPSARCVRSSIASQNCPDDSRSISSTGFQLMSLNTSNPDNDPIDISALHFLKCLEFPQWLASDKAVQLPNATYRHAIELTFQEKPCIIKKGSGI